MLCMFNRKNITFVTEEDEVVEKPTSNIPEKGSLIIMTRKRTITLDSWDGCPMEDEDHSKFSELDCKKKLKVILSYAARIVALVGLLYMFVCSLKLLSYAFRLVGGKAAGAALSNNKLLSNPVAGLMIGVLATVLLQSSSTTTSIVVNMCGAGILEVRMAIPIIMGANIGTSVTNTIVSLAQSSDRREFKRAFAAATVHDMFNWLSVIVLLPVEVISGYLYWLTKAIVDAINLESAGGSGTKIEMLNKITKPFLNLIVQVDSSTISKIATGELTSEKKRSLLKYWCKYEEYNATVPVNGSIDYQIVKNGTEKCVFSHAKTKQPTHVLANKPPLLYDVYGSKCKYLFHGMSDELAGGILLAVSLVALCVCLILIVKVLHSMLQGPVAKLVHKTVNANFPGPFAYFTGYLAICVGAALTIVVQSSSIFTSALTPLVGIGALKITRMYPLTLGSNIGTTGTGILAALAGSESAEDLKRALQIGFCHLFFNLSGILLFYPIPYMRFPISMAKLLGNTTSKYRWFAFSYLILLFFLLPAIVFALSFYKPLLFTVGGLFALILLSVLVINVLQRKKPQALPVKMRNWDYLPKWMHSLSPADRQVNRFISIFKHYTRKEESDLTLEKDTTEGGAVNIAMDQGSPKVTKDGKLEKITELV